MCRLYGFRANEETKVECSLVHAQNALLMQSRSDLRGASHPHGWGLGFYHNSMPDLERSATAAFEDAHFSTTAERVFSQTVIAHVRMATVGGASLENTHPFTHGHWVFAHNGTVTAFVELSEQLMRETEPTLQRFRRGVTDSEQLFYWLLSRMLRAGISLDAHTVEPELLLRVVADSIALLSYRCDEAGADKPAKLNFLLTNGVVMIASRWKNSLYWIHREGIHDCEICGIPHVHHHSGVDYKAIVIASEPISYEEWLEIPDRTMISVDAEINVRIREIESAGST